MRVRRRGPELVDRNGGHGEFKRERDKVREEERESRGEGERVAEGQVEEGEVGRWSLARLMVYNAMESRGRKDESSPSLLVWLVPGG